MNSIAEKLSLASEELFLQGFVRAPRCMDFIELAGTGAADSLLGVIMLAHQVEDTAGKVVDSLLIKPSGVVLFGL